MLTNQVKWQILNDFHHISFELIGVFEHASKPARHIKLVFRCAQQGNPLTSGNVQHVLRDLAAVHHDNRGRTDDHLVPFAGVIDWPELAIGFQKVGYDGTLMLELAAADDGPTATLRRAGGVRRRLESMLADTSFAFSEE